MADWRGGSELIIIFQLVCACRVLEPPHTLNWDVLRKASDSGAVQWNLFATSIYTSSHPMRVHSEDSAGPLLHSSCSQGPRERIQEVTGEWSCHPVPARAHWMGSSLMCFPGVCIYLVCGGKKLIQPIRGWGYWIWDHIPWTLHSKRVQQCYPIGIHDWIQANMGHREENLENIWPVITGLISLWERIAG